MRRILLALSMFAASIGAAGGAGYDALNVGIQYANDQAWDNALIWLDKAISAGDLLPDQVRAAHYNKAIAFARSGRPTEAIPEYTAALELTPDDVQLLVDRALAHLAAGQSERAVADLRIAHDKKPKNARINLALGLVNLVLDRPKDASAAFSDALDANKSRYAWLWLKISDLKQKKETPAYSGPYRSDRWPSVVVNMYAGKAEESEVLREVKDYGESENCEALFYIAEWRLLHNDPDGGKSLLQKTASDCSSDDMEPLMAKTELGKLP